MKNDKYKTIINSINSKNIVLASQSPRRAQLLKLLGFDFQICPSHVDEDSIQIKDPVKHVLELSRVKAKEIADSLEYGLVIGADTIVVLDGLILGKPADKHEASDMLSRLSGKTHQVYTGFTVVENPGGNFIFDYEVTNVHFRELNDWEIQVYVDTQNPFDKAGAYGIQDQSAVFADRIEGCFYNVVGFPVTKFYTRLLKMLNY